MEKFRFLLIGIFILFSGATSRAQEASISLERGNFFDVTRNRQVPYKVYYPQKIDGQYPIIVFSHGLGGTRETASFLGEYLAARGYICFHIQHHGSDDGIWRGAKGIKDIKEKMRKSLLNPKNAEDRFKDIPFVVDQIELLNQNHAKFKGHLNLARLGMMGHSYGAKSTLIAAGEKIFQGKISVKEPRFKAAVALSPNLPENAPSDLDAVFGDIHIPIFHITGTNDGDPLSVIPKFTPEQRTLPYQSIQGVDQYLLVLDQANHYTLGGVPSLRDQDPYYKKHLENIQQGVAAFFDFYLKELPGSENRLQHDFKTTLTDKDRFEWKKGK